MKRQYSNRWASAFTPCPKMDQEQAIFLRDLITLKQEFMIVIACQLKTLWCSVVNWQALFTAGAATQRTLWLKIFLERN